MKSSERKKEVPERGNRQMTDWENILAIAITEKEPISLMYKQFSNQKDVPKILEEKKTLVEKLIEFEYGV